MAKTLYVVRAFCDRTNTWVYRSSEASYIFDVFDKAQFWENKKKAEREAKNQQGREVNEFPWSGQPSAHVLEITINEPE